MPINGFSVGRDVVLDIVGPDGPIRFSLITKFSSKPDTEDKKIKGLDGRTRPVIFAMGWSGTFEAERTNDEIDSYFAQLEANYHAGINNPPCTITETIQEADGSVSQYRFEGVMLKLDDAGSWEGGNTVNQKLSFTASERKKIS
jgi:hypothetical protein